MSELRDERDRIRDLVGIAAARLAVARAAVAAATAGGADGPELDRLNAAVRSEAAALAKVKALETDVRERLTQATAQAGDPVQAIGTLDARVPVAFLPVRVETRFRRTTDPSARVSGELLVRIYPDAILADAHEPLLTADEVEAGRDYWRRAFGLRGEAQQDPERDAWTALLNETTESRAAWIVERTTPVNLGDRGTGAEPQLPDLEIRPDGWHRAPEARGLPERWIVTAIRGDRRVRAVSGPVREGLALTPRLTGDDEEEDDGSGTVDLSGDGLAVEPELAWAYDFDEAVAAGMAVRVPLDPFDMANGFDLLLVAGVRTGDPAADQAAELERLLDAHRFSTSLQFLAQGTKTNNTTEQPSDFPPADPAGAASFPVRRGQAQATPGTDGARVAAALGIGTGPLDHVRGAGRDEQAPARAMADALWAGTIGYFLDQLMAPRISRVDADSVRAWLHDWVRPRGPLPALAVGEVPYGLLPVGDTDSWGRVEAEGVPPRLPDLLRRLGTHLPADAAPHVGRTGDPEADLIEVLGMDASTQTVRVRRTLGYDAIWNVLTFSGADLGPWERAQQEIADLARARLREDAATFDPRVLYLSHAARADDFADPLVTDDPLSEIEPLAFDYIAWLADASIDELKQQAAPPTNEPVTALLYLMLRHALLAEYDRAARRVLNVRKLAHALEDREPELVEIVQTSDRPGAGLPPPQRTAWERFDLRVEDLTSDATLGSFLIRASNGGESALPADVRPIVADLSAYRRNLKALAGLPTAELHRLFTETLDIASHRLDAWLTSLATRRLATMREQVPAGIWLGCYGWVHDLRPDADPGTREVTLTDGTTAAARTDSDGYLYAPSMLHGATAAVLRSAYLARSGPEQEPYTVDLDSRRVRTALGLLDAVRDSQPLGAVLGYRFERGLHDRGHDRFIDTLRGLFPQVANKVEDTGEPAEAVAARNVVDGLALLRAWQAGTIPFGTGELPADGAGRDAIDAELRGLDDATDALSDLLLAESVHQVVKGSPAGAAATLDTLAKGQRPPEPEVAAIPRGGTVLHQRVVLVLGDGTPAPGWTRSTPRATATPELNAWLGRLLGPAAALRCLATPEGGAPVEVSVADLGLQPVDLVALAGAAPAEPGQAELDRRVAWHVNAVGPDRPVTIDYDATSGTPLGAALELAAAAGRLLGFGRPLTPADLLPPELDPSPADGMDLELAARTTAARTSLAAAREQLAGAAVAVATGGGAGPLRAALVTAAGFGIPGAYPPGRHGDDDAALVTLAVSVTGELDRRIAAAARRPDPAAAMQAVFGRGLPVVPRFRPAVPELLDPALAAEPGLGPEPDATVEGWLAQLARVRPPLDAWRDVRILARALGAAELGRPRIVQLPLDPGAAWAGLPFATQTERHRSGLVSLALAGEPPPAPDRPWAGLLLDAWPEFIPSAEEDAGVAFHFDAPRAEAPSAVLLAVPSKVSGSWDWEVLERTLLSTFVQAQVRALDLPGFGRYGQFLPMTFLAANKANEAVSTSFTGLLRADAVIATGDGG